MFDTVRGYPVVACQLGWGESVVVCDRGANGPTHRYVTWRAWEERGEVKATAGYYTESLDDAVANMVRRAMRP